MIYRTHRPVPPLNEFVDWLWFYSDSHAPHSLERVLPDGTFELVIDLRETPRKLYHRTDTRKFREFRGAWISGSRAEHIVIDALDHASMLGVHFKPGGAAAFIGMPADKLTGIVEEAEGVWGVAIKDLREAILEEQSISARFALLETFLRERLRWPEKSKGLDLAIRRIAEQPELACMTQVAGEFGMSQKHFIALFRERVGLTPKKFCRVRRFHKALREIEARNRLDWADIACASGYYDQSHFIRDFQAFSGINPSTYLCDRGEYLGFVPIRE